MGDASSSTSSSIVIIIKISKNKQFIMKTWPGAIGVKTPGNNIFYTMTIWLMEWRFKLFLPPSNTHTAETLHAHTVWFAHLCVPKPSSCKPVDRQTATTAGLRTVNSSLCPGYWAYYCISAKNTHTHSHIHTHTHRGYTGCVWALIRACERTWFNCTISRTPWA